VVTAVLNANHFAKNAGNLSVIGIVIGIAAFALVGCYRQIALKRSWLDQPNERSSHRALTPRGAGIVFAVLITGTALLYARHDVAVSLSLLLAFGVALAGWWDDLRGLSARLRLTLYGLSAIGIAITVAPLLLATAPPMRLALMIVAIAVSLVWLINLYNFMDGINGIAGFETIFVLAAIIWLGHDTPFNAQLGSILWASLYAIAGFLVWNFPTARVFMGDAGSAYLGALLGVLMLWSLQLDGPSLFSWLILLAVFISDTAYTLTVRLISGQRWYLAHRLHGYQILCDIQQSHTRTVVIIASVNLFWLLPCAWFARNGGVIGASLLLLAYLPLLAACRHLRAGVLQRATV
jgi:Fuc2NAc and GlcNAc transferase